MNSNKFTLSGTGYKNLDIVETGNFPGGEVRMKLNLENLRYPLGVSQGLTINAKIVNSDGVMTLLMLTDALRRLGTKQLHLFLPYLPYARQDRMMTDGLRQLKPTIMARQPDMFGLAKFVVRPDSGDPVKIMMGDPSADQGSPQHKGTLRCLLEVFDPTTTATKRTQTGHWMLDPHIGTIYGDAINLKRGTDINGLMFEQGFCSSNSVYGIGSYTYQLVSRDTFNHAYKTTNAIIDGEHVEMFKDPKTGDGMKTSLRGYIRVEKEGQDFVAYDQQTPEQEKKGELQDAYIEGKFPNMVSLSTIRERLIPGFYNL